MDITRFHNRINGVFIGQSILRIGRLRYLAPGRRGDIQGPINLRCT